VPAGRQLQNVVTQLLPQHSVPSLHFCPSARQDVGAGVGVTTGVGVGAGVGEIAMTDGADVGVRDIMGACVGVTAGVDVGAGVGKIAMTDGADVGVRDIMGACVGVTSVPTGCTVGTTVTGAVDGMTGKIAEGAHTRSSPISLTQISPVAQQESPHGSRSPSQKAIPPPPVPPPPLPPTGKNGAMTGGITSPGGQHLPPGVGSGSGKRSSLSCPGWQVRRIESSTEAAGEQRSAAVQHLVGPW
jgi:hypothetical protein